MNATNKFLGVVFCLVSGAVLWQLVAVSRRLVDVRSRVSSLSVRLDEVQDDLRNLNGRTTAAARAMQSRLLDRMEARTRLREPDVGQPPQPDQEDTAPTPAETGQEIEQPTLADLQSQLQQMTGGMDEMQLDVQTLMADLLDLQAGVASISSDVTALGYEIVRLGSAIEEMSGR